jgi:hypothetical protein
MTRPLTPHDSILHVVPVHAVRSTDDHLYIIDHHHLARALWEVGIEHVFIVIEEQPLKTVLSAKRVDV